MTSERSKRRDFLSLIFIAKSISKKLLIQMKQCNFIILEPGCGTVYFYITFTLIRLKY